MEHSLIRKLNFSFGPSDTVISSGNIVCPKTGADILYDILKPTIDMTESFVVVYVNHANNVIGYSVLFTGGIASCIVDVRVIFATALSCMATAIVIGHNHPSGRLTPSREDEKITSEINEAGKMLNIKLLDHIIVTPSKGQYYSFTDNGLL